MKLLSFERIHKGLSVYWNQDDEIHEGRLFHRGRVISRLYRSKDEAAAEIFALASECVDTDNFYIGANPVDEKQISLIDRAVCDRHIARFRHLVLDHDRKNRTVDGQKVSATEQELQLVRICALNTLQVLEAQFGWKKPVQIMSGNGFHSAYDIDLPNDDHAKHLISKTLKAANHMFQTPEVEIDTALCNASRIMKIPGVPARKGPNTPERPHRMAEIVFNPTTPPFLSRSDIERVAAFAPTRKGTSTIIDSGARKADAYVHRYSQGQPWSRERLLAFLHRTGIPFRSPIPFEGGEKFVLEQCPFGPHRKVTAAVFFWPDGRIGFNCKESPDCDGRSWRDFRAVFDRNNLRAGAQHG